MPDTLPPAAAPRTAPPAMPRPPLPRRPLSQVESFLVLRRNPLGFWGAPAYEQEILSGRFLGREQLLVNDPEGVRHVLVANQASYARSLATRRVLRPVGGEGLFLAEDEAWRRQRRTIARALAPRAMPVLARHVVRAAAAEEAALAGLAGRPVELLPRLQHLALGIAGQSMFSLEMEGFAARRGACEAAPDAASGGGSRGECPIRVPRGECPIRLPRGARAVRLPRGARAGGVAGSQRSRRQGGAGPQAGPGHGRPAASLRR